MRAKKIAAATLAIGMFAIAGCSSSSTSSSSSSSAAATSGSAAASGSAPATSGEPFKISYISSISGAYAPFAEAINASVDAAVNQINEDGGILGRQVVVTKIDDGSDPTKAVNAAQEIVNDEDNLPDAVIPGVTSLTTIPVLPVFARAGIPTASMSTSTAANDPEKFPLNFVVSNTPAQAIKGLVSELKKQGITKIAVIGVDNETGHSTTAIINEQTAANGITVTGTELMAPSTVDATAALSSLEASNPEALVVAGISGPLAGTVFKDRTKIGWDAPAFTDVTTTANDLPTLSGGVENLKGVTVEEVPYAVAGDPLQQTEAFKQFITGFQAVLPETKMPLAANAAGWNTMSFLQGAFNKAGSTDPEAYQKAAESLQATDSPLWFATAGPDLGFSATNHTIINDDWVFAPAGLRDSNGSLIVTTN